MIFISLEEVLEIHSDLIFAHGGLDGVRDMGLLISAIEMPKAQMFGEYLHVSVFDKAAAYIYHIVCNHAFLDGNKRTGLATGLNFLDMNGFEIHVKDSALIEMVCKVACGEMKKEEISKFLEESSK